MEPRELSLTSVGAATPATALAVADLDKSGIDDLVVSFGDPRGL